MKILVVVDSIDIEDSSGSKANVALIQNLKRAGFETLVYHYSRKEIHLEGIKCVSIKEIKFSFMYFLSRTQRKISKYLKININTKVESLFGFSFTFFNDVNSITKALEKETHFQPDWVLTLSYASSFRPHKALLALPKWHPKWLAYVHDPYPMHSYPRPYDWVEPGHQFKRDFFLKIVNHSQYLLYPSQLLADWMKSYYPGQKNEAVIVPHQIAEEIFNKEKILTYLNPNDFIILHAGNMMSARNPMSLIEAFEQFLEQNPEAKACAKLYFIGAPSCFDESIREKQKKLAQLFLSDGSIPFKKVLVMQQQVTVNVILEALGPISPFLPGKFAHCIQSRKPILLLGPFYSESKRLLGEQYPYWSPINDIDKIKEHISTFYQLWLENKGLVNMNREDLLYYLSSDYLKETLSRLKL
ncbi:UDP-glycosyltransferase [Flavobacterium sp. ARAG 55.4]|uniref:UDP-glycosyltransferase n=1 Tax=Flavobacterium sp. ARAG 55.4 TaxID=3451357 RepID=UPI003F4722CB